MADIKSKISIDGAAQYKKAISDITAKGKELSSELKLVTSGFNSNTSAEEKNAKTKEVLARQIDNAREKYGTLAKYVEKATEAYGSNDSRTVQLRTRMNQAQAELNRLTQEFDNVGNEAEDSGSQVSVFGDVLKANLASSLITGGLKAIGTGLKEVGRLAVDLGKAVVSSYADYEQLQGGVTKIFGAEDAKAVMENAQVAFRTVGISANEYMETVTAFSASLIKSLGGDTKTSADLADKALRDMSDNANTYGTDLEMIQNAYKGFARGTYNMLDNLSLGYAGTKEGMQALIKDANEYNKTQGRNTNYQISNYADIINAIHDIQEATGIAGTTEKEALGTITGSINMTKSAWANLITELGKSDGDINGVLENLITSITAVITNISPIIARLADAMPQIASALGPLISQLAPVILEQINALIPQIVSGMTAMLPALLPIALQIVTTIANGLLENKEQFVQGVVSLITGLLELVVTLGPQLLLLGVELVMALASGIGQEIVNLSNKIDAWALANIVQPVKSIVSSMISIGDNIVTGLWNGIQNKAAWIKNMITGWVGDVKTFIKNLFGVASPSKYTIWIGEMLVEGLAKGIKDNVKAVEGAWQGTTALLDIGEESIASAGISGANVVNIYAQQVDDATIDYIYNRFNNRMGVMA